jgi:hypothetical protein
MQIHVNGKQLHIGDALHTHTEVNPTAVFGSTTPSPCVARIGSMRPVLTDGATTLDRNDGHGRGFMLNFLREVIAGRSDRGLERAG